jgi:hypothetical protein
MRGRPSVSRCISEVIVRGDSARHTLNFPIPTNRRVIDVVVIIDGLVRVDRVFIGNMVLGQGVSSTAMEVM